MNEHFVVTISHQLGCGGAYVGKKLSEMLSVPFVDRQILKMAADNLNMSEAEIEGREERKASFWESFYRMEMLNDPVAAMGTEYYPTDKELYKLESEYIEKIANEGSAVILGRGGRAILRDHPRHFSVFIHADMPDRVQRVSKLYNVPTTVAQKIIEKNDKERNLYIETFTKLKWLDARKYDLCVNTSAVGVDSVPPLIKDCMDHKFKK